MITPSDSLRFAAYVAQDWHGGQGSALYRFSCAQWDHLTRDDIEAALREFNRCEAAEWFSDEAAELDDAKSACAGWLYAHPPTEGGDDAADD